MRRLSPILLAVLLGAPAVWAALQHARASRSEALLTHVARANKGASYKGVIRWNGKWSRHPITVRHDAVHGRTEYAFSRGRKFVLNRPSSRMPDPTAWCRDPKLLVANYTATEREPRQYLGREVRVLAVKPRHRGRPSLEVWVDAVSGLALKVSTFREDGSLYRVAKFDSIEFGSQDIEAAELQKIHKWHGTEVPTDDPVGAAGFAAMTPDYAPAGFELVEARVRQRATPQLTLLYSDGATAFEIKQSPKVTPAALEAHYASRYGARMARSKVRWHVAAATRRLVRSDTTSGTTAVRHKRRSHSTWKLRVADLDLELIARNDIEPEEMLRVLQSLRLP